MERLLDEFLASTVLGGLTSALGLVLLLTQRRTRTNVGSSTVTIVFGLAVLTGLPSANNVDASDPALWTRLQVVFEAIGIAGGSLYLQGLFESARTTGPRAARVIRATIVSTRWLAVVHLVLGAMFPAQRLNDFQVSVGAQGFASTSGFWLFAGFWLAVAAAFSISWVMLAQVQLDPGEHTRAVCNVISSPLLVATAALPPRIALLSASLAILAFLFGQFRYLVTEGERGAFLSRFLSPQVADNVRVGGLTSLIQPAEVNLTVVACDLRGFTAYAEAVPSQTVIDLLGEYYDVVGEAVAEVSGTIKDYAGDGILILVGAPLPHPDHAAAGLSLAQRIHDVTRPVLNRWATIPHPLGIGVGVATGRVTVGAIGSDARMEYTAVGTTVNLAARLCSAAQDGETLVDGCTVDATGSSCEPRGTLVLKGLSQPSPVFALAGSPSAAEVD